ncbi:MAG: 4Fe-4S dicluster domain-containing protein [Archangium sp.]
MTRRLKGWSPNPDQMALWPKVSGNAINGLGEAVTRRPRPVYWHPPETLAHGPLQKWFYSRPTSEEVKAARAERQGALDLQLEPLSPVREERSAEEWTREVKRAARDAGAELVGVTAVRSEWFFENQPEPTWKWIVMLGVAQDYEAMRTAPEPPSNAEVVRQYGRGIRIAKTLASWLRVRGWDASPHGGPMAGPLVLIPPAIECGFGELGKHGSLINKTYGSNFRLACVMTDVPLLSDVLEKFGAEDFCKLCRLCADECPPDAILPEQQLVRGETRWYVDFDKCLPYFNENYGCGICMVVCPWSRPGVGETLLQKLARRK